MRASSPSQIVPVFIEDKRFRPQSGMISFLQWMGLLAASMILLVGCAEPTPPFTEVRTVDSPVTDLEWDVFARIIEAIPADRMAKFPHYLPPLPNWSESRRLSVADLVTEEQTRQAEMLQPASMAKLISKDPVLKKILRRETVSAEQLAGFMTAVGWANFRRLTRDTDSIEDVLLRGKQMVKQLSHDHRLFSSLLPDQRHLVLQQAQWLNRFRIAETLKKVPAENFALAEKHKDWIAKHFPKEFQSSPLARTIEHLEFEGIPFEEGHRAGSDDGMGWHPESAIRDPMKFVSPREARLPKSTWRF